MSSVSCRATTVLKKHQTLTLLQIRVSLSDSSQSLSPGSETFNSRLLVEMMGRTKNQILVASIPPKPADAIYASRYESRTRDT